MAATSGLLCALLAGLISASIASSLVYDPVVTAELEEAIKKDEFVLLVKGVRPSKFGNLLEMKFPGEMRHFTLSQEQDTVTVQSGDEALRWSVSRGGPIGLIWGQGSEEDGQESTLMMYKSCSPLAQLRARSSPRDVFSTMEVPSVKLYRDKHVTVHVLTGPALDALGCVESTPKRKNRKKARPSPKPTTQRPADEDPEEVMLAQQPFDENEVPFRRGDISIIHTDNCDDLLVKTINELIRHIQILKNELERQRVIVEQMSQTLENCAGCREPQQQRMTCANNPGTCYQGE